MAHIGRIGLIGLLLLLAAAAVWATATYTAPPPVSSRSTWATNRYATAEEGLVRIDVTTASVADQTVTLDSSLAGYLERVTWQHNGNDTSWKLYIKDTDGLALYSDLDTSAATDPCGVVCNYGTGGVPFSGGLTVEIADADDGTGDAIVVRLYVREAWRR